MNLRDKLVSASTRLRRSFVDTKPIVDSRGKGTQREHALIDELRKFLPKRYSFGWGEVVNTNGETSGELDVVIYDNTVCPDLLLDEGFAVFPIEIVYGVIQVKSELNSTELTSAYRNIRTAKRLIPTDGFTRATHGFATGFGPARILGAVFAYEGGRTIEAISKQAGKLDAELGKDIHNRPDFIAVLDVGIVGPRGQLRGDANSFRLPAEPKELVKVRATGTHTWMRFCLQLIRELNEIQLAPFELTRYLKMPEVVGGHRVRNHDRILRGTGPEVLRTTHKINAKGIKRIVATCEDAETTFGAFMAQVVPIDRIPASDRDTVVRVFNPRNLRRLPSPEDPTHFSGWQVLIDDVVYLVDLNSLAEDEFDQTDVPVADLLE